VLCTGRSAAGIEIGSHVPLANAFHRMTVRALAKEDRKADRGDDKHDQQSTKVQERE
jgi:hypothetical protein